MIIFFPLSLIEAKEMTAKTNIYMTDGLIDRQLVRQTEIQFEIWGTRQWTIN